MSYTLTATTLLHKVSSSSVLFYTSFIWGLAEGLFFFLVPDIYVLLIALFFPLKGLKAWGYSILGSLCSVLIIALFVMFYSPTYLSSLLVYIPGISSELISTVSETINSQGLPYSPLLVLGGIPLKVYVLSAFSQGYSLVYILMWAFVARILRIAPGFFVVMGVHVLLKKSLFKHIPIYLSLYMVFWIIFYIFYFSRMGM